MVCIHICHLLRAQYHCLWPNGKEGLAFSLPTCPITPSYLPTTLLVTPVILQWLYLKNHQWTLNGRVSYETLAICLLYLYSKSCMAIIYIAQESCGYSIFQNDISRNTKCDNLVGFHKSSHICITVCLKIFISLEVLQWGSRYSICDDKFFTWYVYWNLIKHLLYCWIWTGRSSKFLEVNSGTRGLWSVSSWKFIASKYSPKYSHTQLVPELLFPLVNTFAL